MGGGDELTSLHGNEGAVSCQGPGISPETAIHMEVDDRGSYHCRLRCQ